MQLHDLKRNTKRKTHRQRGRGGKRGKTSGRGTKGMLSRAGYKKRPEMRDIIKRLPKLRGYSFASIQAKPFVVNLSDLSVFKAGDAVSPKTLIEKKVVKTKSGNIPTVKILGTGDIAHKLVVSGCLVSASAKAKIEKAGGTVAE